MPEESGGSCNAFKPLYRRVLPVLVAAVGRAAMGTLLRRTGLASVLSDPPKLAPPMVNEAAEFSAVECGSARLAGLGSGSWSADFMLIWEVFRVEWIPPLADATPVSFAGAGSASEIRTDDAWRFVLLGGRPPRVDQFTFLLLDKRFGEGWETSEFHDTRLLALLLLLLLTKSERVDIP